MGAPSFEKVDAHRILSWVLALSFALKLGLAITVRGIAPVNDEVSYLHIANELVENGRYDTLFRPPLYPAFMAALFELGGNCEWVRWSQALMSTLTVWLLYRVARHMAGSRTALVSAAIVAFDPLLIFFSHMLWSETLYLTLLLAAVAWLVIDFAPRPVLRWGGVGALFGAAALARPQLLTFMPWVVGWALFEDLRRDRRDAAASLRRMALPVALLTLGCCAVVLPWTLRNYLTTGSVVLVDTNGPYNFAVSTEPDAAFLDKDDVWSPRWAQIHGLQYADAADRAPAMAQRLAMRAAWQRIADEPGRFVRKCLWEAGHLWTLDSFLLRHLRNGWYGEDQPSWLLPVVLLVSVPFSVLLVTSGVLGLAAHRPHPFRSLCILSLAHATLLFGLTYALSRYSLAMRPLLAVFAAWLWVGPGNAGDRLRRAFAGRVQATVVTLCLLGLVSVWLRDLPLLADNLLRGGSDHLFQRLP